MKGICVNVINGPIFSIPQETRPWQPIWGKIGKLTFIQQAGIF